MAVEREKSCTPLKSIYNTRGKTRQIPIVRMYLRDASMKCLETDLFRSPVLNAGGKTGGPRENLRKQVWTGNQMHIRRHDCESNPGPLVHSAGEEPLHYLLPLQRLITSIVFQATKI